MENSKISEKKLFTILTIDLFSMTGLFLPSVIVRESGKNGLSVLLLACGFAFLGGAFFLWVSKNGEMAYENAIFELPSVVRRTVSAFYCIRFFLHGLCLMIIFTELIQEVLLPKQARLWIAVPMLILAFFSTGKSISVRGSILEVLFPFIFFPLLLVLFLALFELDYKSLSGQMFGSGWNLNGFLGSYKAFLLFQPMEFLLFLASARKPEQGKNKYTVGLAFLFVMVVNIIIYVATIGLFGTVRTGKKLWSALYIMQSVKLPGHFVERMDILFLIFYIFSTFALFSGYLFYSEMLVTKDLHGWKKKIYPFIYLAVVLIIIGRNPDVEQFFNFYIKYKMWIDVPLAFLIPLFIKLWREKTFQKSRAVSLFCLTLFLVMGLVGCQDKVDLEDRNYVMSLGLEKEEKLQFSYEIADLSEGSGEGGGSIGKGKMLFYEGDSFSEIEEKVRNSNDKQMDYGHLKALLFPKEMTETSYWNEIIEELEERENLAGTILVFFTEGSPKEYQKMAEDMGTTLGEYLERMMSNQSQEKEKQYTLSDLLTENAEGIHKKEMPVLEVQGEKIYLQSQKWEDDSSVYNQVLRFHIRANSDNAKDQQLKNNIKDKVLPYLQNLFSGCTSKEMAVETAKTNLSQIKERVIQAGKEEGEDTLFVNAYLCKENFPVKQYGTMIFPSGEYEALRIDLGKGEGENWWCMMYPSLCLVDGVVEGVTEEAQDKLEASLDEKEYENLFYQEKEKKFYVKCWVFEKVQKFFGKMSP